MEALVGEAMRKAAVAWLTVPGRPAYPVWCHWIDDALYLVSGVMALAAVFWLAGAPFLKRDTDRVERQTAGVVS